MSFWDELIDCARVKKLKYLTETTEEYTNELEEIEKKTAQKLDRASLTDEQLETYKLLQKGISKEEIAKLRGVRVGSLDKMLKRIKDKGYPIKFEENSKETPKNYI